MGNDIGILKCCTQGLIPKSDDECDIDSEDNVSTTEEVSKSKSIKDEEDDEIDEFDESEHTSSSNEEYASSHSDDVAPILPHRALSVPKHTKSPKRTQHKQTKFRSKAHRRMGREKRSFSMEEALDQQEIDLAEMQRSIKLLKKQNRKLRKQNDEFVMNYGSHFTLSPHTQSSISPNTRSRNSICSQISDLSAISPILSYSNEYEQGPISVSPLTPLTNNQMSIILSFPASEPKLHSASYSADNNEGYLFVYIVCIAVQLCLY